MVNVGVGGWAIYSKRGVAVLGQRRAPAFPVHQPLASPSQERLCHADDLIMEVMTLELLSPAVAQPF